MLVAYRLGNKHLPVYASKFSRHDFTLSQLFACLVLRQFYNLSYRRVQSLLQDSSDLRQAIGLQRTPDHNTLCDAFEKLTSMKQLAPMFDELAQVFEQQGLLDLEHKPAAADATHFEPHYASRHYEKRKRDGIQGTKAEKRLKKIRKNSDVNRGQIRDALRKLPKLGFVVAAGCHLVLSAWAGLGAGSDHAHAETVLYHAWKRAPVKTFVADAGYDGEPVHCLVRRDLNCDAIIPPLRSQSQGYAPKGVYRLEMMRRFADGSVADVYGQRWQAETAVSMLKRNYGSFLRSRTTGRRMNEMLLKVMTHNIAV